MALFATAVMSWGQDITLTPNDDGTWTLAAMPAYDICLQVEYVNDSIPPATDDIILTKNADGTWTLSAMPAHDVVLMVEYEDVEPGPSDDIILTENADGTWTLAAMPAYDIILVVEYDYDPDGIKSLSPDHSDGETYIYNVAGQRMSKLHRGLNIVNGKKVFIK